MAIEILSYEALVTRAHSFLLENPRGERALRDLAQSLFEKHVTYNALDGNFYLSDRSESVDWNDVDSTILNAKLLNSLCGWCLKEKPNENGMCPFCYRFPTSKAPAFLATSAPGGDLMTIADYQSCVENGSFIDDDGFAELAIVRECILYASSHSLSPSESTEIGPGITHVIWYNR